jgi:hypothetical protein
VRRQLRALARALKHILCEEEEGGSDGAVAMEEGREERSLEEVSSVLVGRCRSRERRGPFCAT